MAVQWTSNLQTGSDIIDNQHKKLFECLNDLLNAMARGKGKEEIFKTIGFLEKYIIEHFTQEEKLMFDINYPDYQEHKDLHKDFMDEVAEIKNEFETKGNSSFLTIQVQKKLVDWLVNHIGKSDKLVGEYFSKH